MPVTPLFQVPTSEREQSDWSFAHMVHHRDMIDAVRRIHGVRLTQYQLDPVDLRDPGGWLLYHQQMHSDLDSVLGTTNFGGFAIETLEFNDPAAAQGWIWQHASMHYQEALASQTW